jgi:hypothetical protein
MITRIIAQIAGLGPDLHYCTRLPDHTAIVAAYAAGDSVQMVAQRFGLTRTSVYQVLRRNGLPLRGRR